MSNKDDGLSQLVQDVIDGKAEKKELCNKIYKEVYALAYPVYQNEEKSMTQAKKALIEICKRIGDFNLERNIHKQVATIASAFFFTSVVSENAEELRNNAPTGEYEYTHIKDDEEFVTYMKQKAIAFRSPKSFDQQEESFRNLSEIEMSLTELYAYEMLSVDAIESVTDVDSSYISGWLAGIRSYVLGYETAGNADNNDMAAVADNDYNSLDESDYSDEEYDDRKTGKRLKENAVTLFIKRLFPALTLPARMMVSWIAGGVIVIILIIILVVSVKAGKSNKKSASYEYQNMQYTTEQAATKNNKKNEAATASTEAGTEEQTTQKQTENVTQSTTGSSSNNTTNRTTANTSDDDSITGNTSSDNSGSTDNDTNGSGDTGSTDNGASGSGTTGGSTDNGTGGSGDTGSTDNGTSGSGTTGGSTDNGTSGSGTTGGSTDSGASGSGTTGGSTDSGASGSTTTGGSTDNGASGSSTGSGSSSSSGSSDTVKSAASGVSAN